ncbi:Protein kinase-like domain protein [Metarhizium robertsii ARSEF 23]|nr:Protein kinase-like domain protein [Metarhizium robertsii ARSEF 23]EFZ02052.1 Protein kinase-like domain protein [Metarhizium robertsii ARSEF 23]
MSGSGNSPSVSSPSKESVADKACKLANRVILAQIQTKLKRNPATNLSPFLRQQSESYDEFVANLAAGQNAESDSEDEDCPDLSNELCGLVLGGSPEIIHALHDRVLELSSGGATTCNLDNSKNLPMNIVAGLNEAIQGGQVLWRLHDTFVIGLGSSEVVKISTSLDLDEISNLEYLNSLSLGIPIPLCLGALRSGRRVYLFMSRASGQPLEMVWPQLTPLHKTSIQQQLIQMFTTLRSIPPSTAREEMKIGSFASGICKDTRRCQRVSVRPIYNEIDFNDFLCHEEKRTQTAWIKMIRSAMRADHDLVATHADLHPRNIMVEWDTEEGGTLHITAIIDWEPAGWYPEHWEFVKALHTVDIKGALADWYQYLPTAAIGSWPTEFSLDLLIGRWLG